MIDKLKEYLTELSNRKPQKLRVSGNVHFKAESRGYVKSVKDREGNIKHQITDEGLAFLGVGKTVENKPEGKKKAAGKKK